MERDEDEGQLQTWTVPEEPYVGALEGVHGW